MAKKKVDPIDAKVEQAFRKNCSGVQISIWDMGKVIDAGRKAIAEGKDLDSAIVEFVNTIRFN